MIKAIGNNKHWKEAIYIKILIQRYFTNQSNAFKKFPSSFSFLKLNYEYNNNKNWYIAKLHPYIDFVHNLLSILTVRNYLMWAKFLIVCLLHRNLDKHPKML